MKNSDESIQSVPENLVLEVVESDTISDNLERSGDTVVVPADNASTPRANWVLPAVLGAVLLAVSIYFPTRPNFVWAFSPSGAWAGTVNFLLVGIGVVLAVLLFVYAIRTRRQHAGSSDSSLSPAKFAVPIMMWLVGMSAIAYSFLLVNNRYNEPQRLSCVELYGEMVAVAKQNPGFRLSPADPDEQRCGINKAIFG